MVIRSPLAYQGSKFKLLPELLEVFGRPKVFHDVFGGSAVVSLNMVDSAGSVHYNDHDENISRIIKRLAKDVPTVSRIKRLARHYKIDELDRDGYYWFRNEIANKYKLPLMFFLLSKVSYCSLLRFNRKNECNIPYGNRGRSILSKQNMRSLSRAIEKIRLIHSVSTLSYLQYVKEWHKKADGNHLFYFDPPYFASGASVYKGDWTVEDDKKLFSLLDYMDGLGLRWVLSNVTHHKSHVNKQLIKWMKRYTVVYPTFGGKVAYNLDRARVSGKREDNRTVEVIIKNF